MTVSQQQRVTKIIHVVMENAFDNLYIFLVGQQFLADFVKTPFALYLFVHQIG